MIAPESESPSTPNSATDPNKQNSDCSDFAERSGCILVVGHGTRNPSGAEQLLELVRQMQSKDPKVKVVGCFLELAEPSIEAAVEQIHILGFNKILVVPVLLFTAAHALQDIPDAVSSAAAKFGIEVIGQTGSLGTHPAVIALSQVRYSEVSLLGNGNCCPEGACARVHCSSGQCESQHLELGRIGLAMVGRGTSDPQALAHMRQLTAMKMAELSALYSQTGFFAGGRPTVDGLLEEASTWDCETVLVQPHLLFEGELIEQLRRKVMECQSRWPDKNWLVARTLGADPKLADVFLELAREKLANQ